MILIFPFHYSYILNTIHSLNYAYSKQANCTLWTFLVLKAAIKIKVKIARFSSFSKNFFCYIWWFFRVLQHIWHSPLWKIIKYWNKFWNNEEKSLPCLENKKIRYLLGELVREHSVMNWGKSERFLKTWVRSSTGFRLKSQNVM